MLTGLRTQVALVSGGYEWLVCALIVVVATLPKFGSTAVAARGAGLDWREATALGVLMNTRGLMELIVLNVGLELGVISPTLSGAAQLPPGRVTRNRASGDLRGAPTTG